MTDHIVKRVILPRRDPRLDRLVVHDERSRDYSFSMRGSESFTRVSTRHRSHIGIMNQRNLGGCVGYSSTKCMSHDPFYMMITAQLLRGHYHENNQFARAVYSDCTHVDEWSGEWPPTDTGSSGLAAGKVFLARGDIASYTHAFNTEDALDALVQQPWIMGINWYDGMFTPDADGFITPSGELAGGHEICVDEINVEDQYIEGPNSWGPRWGLNGRFRMKWDVLDQLLSEDGDVTIFTPLSLVSSGNISAGPIMPGAITAPKIQGGTI